jgi:hypothetical protein
MNAPFADERRMLARTRPFAFDSLRDMARISNARWRTGDALRRLHAAGWAANGSDVTTIQTPEARAARERLAEIEAAIDPALWVTIRRCVLEGATLRELHALLPLSVTPQSANAILLDRLALALDRAGPLLPAST